MSYKYHERAVVFNEKNLVRLWDVAYDGYVGGKDATSVDWTDPDKLDHFKSATHDTSQNYKGPSLMVMAFQHDSGSQEYRNGFQRNWPSPIVYHDNYDYTQPPGNQHDGNYTLSVDYDNVHVTNVKDMRVFNNPLYGAYRHYFHMMPNFSSLHAIRKPAGSSTVDNQTFYDSLAFQGSMRTFQDGHEVDSIQGSGHHGPDWVGAASIRSGKGYKIQGAPVPHRMV
jgi:hypothetical protein